MRHLLLMVLLFAVAVLLATLLGANDGLVSIYLWGWRTDLSLNLFVLITVLSGLGLGMLWRWLHTLFTLPERAKRWRAQQLDQRSQTALRDALLQYFAGRYSRSMKSAKAALQPLASGSDLRLDPEFKVLAHLLLAASAHRLQDHERRNEHAQLALQTAQKVKPSRSAEESVRLLEAEWRLDERQAGAALEILEALPQGVARRTQALRLKLQALRRLRQPHEALKTARLLNKHQAFSAASAQGLLRALAFEVIAAARDLDQLRRVWQQFDAAERRDASIVTRAASHAAALGAFDEGRTWLAPQWARFDELQEDDRSVLSMALVDCRRGLTPDWLVRLESALEQHAREPAVGFAVGMAFAERRLWGKASKLLEAASLDERLPTTARRQAHLQRAALALSLGDQTAAQDSFKAAAEMF